VTWTLDWTLGIIFGPHGTKLSNMPTVPVAGGPGAVLRLYFIYSTICTLLATSGEWLLIDALFLQGNPWQSIHPAILRSILFPI
jgi:hypothetical protein